MAKVINSFHFENLQPFNFYHAVFFITESPQPNVKTALRPTLYTLSQYESVQILCMDYRKTHYLLKRNSHSAFGAIGSSQARTIF